MEQEKTASLPMASGAIIVRFEIGVIVVRSQEQEKRENRYPARAEEKRQQTPASP